MKNTILSIFTLLSSLSYAQIIIGDEVGTATNKTSVLLEFAKTQNKGIILPYVRTLPVSPTEGTLILDASVPNKAKVKYYNGKWTDLSVDEANVTAHLSSQNNTSQPNAKVIIGSDTTNAEGILVLESTSKTMVLPQVNSTNDIINPAPGMMVYVNNTQSKEKLLAIFNGNSWSFFAP